MTTTGQSMTIAERLQGEFEAALHETGRNTQASLERVIRLAETEQEHRQIGLNLLEIEGIASLRRHQYQDALPLLAALSHFKPNDHATYFNLGLAFFKLGEQPEYGNLELTQAKDAFLNAYTRQPRNEKYFFMLLKAAELLTDYEFIIRKMVLEGADVKVQSARNFSLLGIAYAYGRQDWGSAREYFQRALEKEKSPLHLVNIAETYAAQENMTETYKYFEQAKQLLQRLDDGKKDAAREKITESIRIGIDKQSYRHMVGQKRFDDYVNYFRPVRTSTGTGVLSQEEVDELLKAVEGFK